MEEDLAYQQQTNSLLDYVDDKYGIYPIWLCLCKTSYEGLLKTTSLEEFYIDIGIYGSSCKVQDKDKWLTELEHKTYSNQGFMGQ